MKKQYRLLSKTNQIISVVKSPLYLFSDTITENKLYYRLLRHILNHKKNLAQITDPSTTL